MDHKKVKPQECDSQGRKEVSRLTFFTVYTRKTSKESKSFVFILIGGRGRDRGPLIPSLCNAVRTREKLFFSFGLLNITVLAKAACHRLDLRCTLWSAISFQKETVHPRFPFGGMVGRGDGQRKLGARCALL